MHLMSANINTSVSKIMCSQSQPLSSVSGGGTGSLSTGSSTRMSAGDSSPPVIQSVNTVATVTPPSLSTAALSSYIDNDNIRILNQIFDKLADLDHKLAIVTEYLVSYPGNANNSNQAPTRPPTGMSMIQPTHLPNGTPQINSAFAPPPPPSAPLGLSPAVSLPNVNMSNGVAGLLAAAQHQQDLSRQQSVIVPSAWHAPVSSRKRHASESDPNEQTPAPPMPSAMNDHLNLVAQHQARAEWIAQLIAHNQATHKRMQEDRDSPVITGNTYVPQQLNQQLRVPVINEHSINEWAASCTSTMNNDDERMITTSASLKLEEDSLDQHPGLASRQESNEPQHHASAHELGIYGKMFSAEAIRRAIEKAARSFDATKPKVFAWQLLRESVSDNELPRVHISLRTFQGETADDLLNRQLVIVRNVVLGTLAYFKWDQLAADQRLVKTKIVLSHLKNNTKVRNWTLREGKTHRDRNSPEVLWRRYAAMLGPAGLAAAGLIATPDGAAKNGAELSATPSSTDSP